MTTIIVQFLIVSHIHPTLKHIGQHQLLYNLNNLTALHLVLTNLLSILFSLLFNKILYLQKLSYLA
jgi:hypothetical protein